MIPGTPMALEVDADNAASIDSITVQSTISILANQVSIGHRDSHRRVERQSRRPMTPHPRYQSRNSLMGEPVVPRQEQSAGDNRWQQR